MPSPSAYSSALALLVLASCATGPREALPGSLERSSDWIEGASGRRASWEEVVQDLAGNEVVFLGETHDDGVTHAIELELLRGLSELRGGRVVLALEMFERDQQAVLDRYLRGELDEAGFFAATRTWGNYRAAYRPLIEFAREHGLPVVAANAAASARRKVASGGLEALEGEERAWVADELRLTSAAYWARFDAVMAGHGGPVGEPEPPSARLRGGQSVWDNTMGESVVRSLERRPDHLVLLVVGSFHVEQGQGTVEQVLSRRPGTLWGSLIVEPHEDLDVARSEDGPSKGTWIARAERRDRARSDAEQSVRLGAELGFSLDLPKGASEPRPLLVWFPDDGERPADVRAWLRAELGADAALAVLEAPHFQRRDDLALAGAWFHPERVEEERERLGEAIRRVGRRLGDGYPFDPSRVFVGGRGVGAELAQRWRTALGEAARPASADDLRASLGLAARPSDGLIYLALEPGTSALGHAWAEASAAARIEDPQREHRLVEFADLAGLPSGSVVRPLVFGGPAVAEALRSLHPALEFREALAAGDLTDGRILPLAPGSFGGTTVLWVPGELDEEERAAWKALEEGAITKRSRFASLVVAFERSEPGLAAALEALAEKGTESALVVPAVFAAAAPAMNELRAAAGEATARVRVDWLPGLGAELWRKGADR